MVSTDQLLRLLEKRIPLSEVFNQIPDVDFTTYLEACLTKQNTTKSEVIAKTNIQRNYAYQIFEGSRKAGREKVIQLAIALNLDLHDTNNLLALSNNGNLYPKVKEDAILIYAINHHYDIMKTNELLDAHGFPILT